MELKLIKDQIPGELYKILEKDIIKLRPAQEKAIKKGLLERKNMLVCTPTASGKTLIAELAALKSIIEGRDIQLNESNLSDITCPSCC